MSHHNTRSVFHEKVGQRTNGQRTFHWDLLIADGHGREVSQATQGTRWDWGSGQSGHWRKSDVKPTHAKFDHRKAERLANSWDYIGATDWPDEKVERLLTLLGAYYHVLTRNCRVWTKLAALALVLPSRDFSVDQAARAVGCFDEVQDVHITMLRWEDMRIQPGNDDFRVGLSADSINSYMAILNRLPAVGYYDTSDRPQARSRLLRALAPGFTTAGVSSWDESFGGR